MLLKTHANWQKKIGLAVWRAKPEAFPIFDSWMFTYENGSHWTPRRVEAAKAKALFGHEKFDASMSDLWIDEYLQSCVHIF